MPKIFNDAGWALLNTSILSTSNCGNPALRLFGFGPVAADGYGIGYIIKEDGISVYVSPLVLKKDFSLSYYRCASSKHLQTFRWLDTLEGYLLDIQRLIIQLDKKQREVNLHESAPWLDHEGILRDARTGRRVSTNERGAFYCLHMEMYSNLKSTCRNTRDTAIIRRRGRRRSGSLGIWIQLL